MGSRQNKRIRSKLLIMGKLLASIYLVVFVTAQITSSSGAYFTDSQKETQVLQAADTWWDGSELGYIDKSIKISGDQSQKQTVEAAFQNNGEAMTGATDYQVLFSEGGNPKEGNVVKQGTIGPLQSGEMITLSHKPANSGTYLFKVLQREGYENHHDKSKALFSDKITMEKSDTDEPNDQDEPDKTNNNSDNTK